MPSLRRLLAAGAAALVSVPALVPAQQPIDSAYTAQIRALTPTDPHWKFTTELVDYLPASKTVPTPLQVLGYVPGTVGRLSYVADINRYYRALEKASPRVKVFDIGKSEEGRDMLVVAIADSATIAHLDDYRAKLARLADPRGVTPAERAQLLDSAKPIYWLTGSIHSPETGSPEMLMELAYRLAVDEGPWVSDIRDHVITLITPVTEVDGRDRAVDAFKESRALGLGAFGAGLPYWGKYVAHDNNRDEIGMALQLSRHMTAAYLHWKPVIMHDLHESVPFLYTSTGTGPYNDEFDPIAVDEWYTLAYQEMTELTRRGLPGVWTHGFYDGWAPNYMLAMANLHNGLGKFYETYTSSGSGCQTVHLPPSETSREWDRPSPPVNGVKWCIRSNINYQQSGVLVALKYVADHAHTFLENYADKARNMVEKGRTSAPYAFVIPRSQRHAAEAADLVNLFRAHGAEVQVATSDFTVARDTVKHARTEARQTYQPEPPGKGPIAIHAGDWIVRMDQPFTQTVRTLLAIQHFKADDPEPYDDTGWTLDQLRHVETFPVSDSSVLTKPMQLLAGDARVEGAVAGSGGVLLVAPLGDWRSAVLPWKLSPAKVAVAETTFTAGGASFPAGTFIVENGGSRAADVVKSLGLQGTATSAVPDVRRHAITLPRIAYVHSWTETQNEGWVRFALDQLGVPYTYMSDQKLKDPKLLDRYDVVLLPDVRGGSRALLNGRPMVGPPTPWKTSKLTPNVGKIDQTDDMRPGMGLDGAAALRRFVERGGLLLVEGQSSELPVDLGFNPTVSIASTPRLFARGGVFHATEALPSSPILYGYQPTFAVYFNQAPLFSVQPPDTNPARTQGIDSTILAQGERMRAKVILKFPSRADSLLISGVLANGEQMAGKAAVVDAPVGSGHVVMFGIRPFWRWETQGTFALALNALANWNHLDLDVAPTRAPRSVAAGLQ